MAQPGTDQHQGAVSIRKRANGPCPSLNLPIYLLQHVVPYRVIPSINGSHKDPNEYLTSDPASFKKDVRDIVKKIRAETTAKNG